MKKQLRCLSCKIRLIFLFTEELYFTGWMYRLKSYLGFIATPKFNLDSF